MRDFITALQFLTTIRIVKEEVHSSEEFARSMSYYPLVGLVIGAILAGLAYLANLRLSPLLVGAIILVAEIVISGGLHLDGYMDTMDGIFSGRSRERILEIMKDSRVGAHAVIALGGLFVLKFALLVQLATFQLWTVLLVIPALGRMTMGIGASLFPYARAEGMGKTFANTFSRRKLLVSVAYTAVAAVLLCGWRGLGLWAVAVIWGWLFARFVAGRIGGLTGDVYGALNELTEAVVLLVVVFTV
ncbi:MAG TPA: adenosylcobinamide-GDP ribazoletransferase [Desulfobacteria bacterium]|nr:adenosylcobinamide-GDP ribazoletransferase [Desulfobacteria bacterium]